MDLGAETVVYGHHVPIEGEALIESELRALHEAILHVHADAEFEQALHLLDIVLSEEPEHPEAVSLALKIHQSLGQQSENFCLSSWLENQQTVLRARL